MLFLPANLYGPIYYTLIALLTIVTVLYYSNSVEAEIITIRQTGSKKSIFIAIFIAIIIIILLGYRPVSGFYFVDMSMYAHSFNNIINEYVPVDWSKEWLWENFTFFCKSMGCNEAQYFLVCELLYVVPMLIACIILVPRNVWPAFFVVIASFSFYSYGVNGIRNGIACSLVFLAVAMLTKSNICKIGAIALMIVAYGMHHATLLPSVCAIVSCLIIKDPKLAIAFWGASIVISLVVGNAIGDFFANLGFDDRTSYFEDASEGANADVFSSTGFRFDFLLYSAMPIIMVWYLTIKRNFKDVAYNIISNTYILANAFWIMVIRAEFSNRFAYLSWFIYPIVIAYPLVRMNIWEEQDRKAALILLAYSGFTLFMYFIYYA